MGPATADPLTAFFESFGRLADLRFAAPERLPLAIPILLVLLVAPWMRRGSGGRAVPVALRLLLAAMLFAVLLEPVVEEREWVEGSVLVLADVSSSVGTGGVRLAEEFLARAPAPFDLVTFSAHARAAAGPLEADPADGTDMAGALRLATARAGADRPLRVALLGDGRPTTPGTDEAAAALRRQGVLVDAHALPGAPAPPPEVSLDGLRQRERVMAEDPISLEVAVVAAAATGTLLTLYIDGDPAAKREVALAAGVNVVRLGDLHLAPGRYYAQALVEGDMSPDDNVAGLLIEVPGVPRVLCLGEAARDRLLGVALAAQGMQVRTAAASGPWDLSACDLVIVLPDAPAEALETRAQALAEFVAHRGGGLLFVGGLDGEGLARLMGTSLSLLLPLDVEPRAPPPPPPPKEPTPEPRIEIIEEKTEAYPISLCIAVDRSGSMRGEKIKQAVEAAVAAAEALTPEDRVSVVAFGDDAGVLLAPVAAGNPSIVRRELSGLAAAGRTSMFAGLTVAAALLERERAPIRHLLLISDGVPTDSGQFRSLVEAMAEQRITLSTVGIGFEIDAGFLGNLAKWGRGRYASALHAYEIPQVVAQDAKRVATERDLRGRKSDATPPPREPEAAPRPPPEPPKPPAPPPMVRIVPDPAAPREAFRGIADAALPEVGGVEEGRLRFAAWSAARAGEGGPPLLAYRRVGLGTCAALTVDPEGEGGSAMRAQAEFARIAAQLARSLLPDGGGQPFVLDAEVRGERLVVRLRGEDGAARTDIDVGASVGGLPLALARRADRYEAALPHRASPAVATLRVAGAGERRMILPASASVEGVPGGADLARLARVAGGPGGVDRPAEEALAPPRRERTVPRPLALPFLVIAAMLFPVEAWARRVASSGSR